MEEKIFFNEGGVTVSNSRFDFKGQTYAMSGITSIKSVKVDPSRIGPSFLLLISIGFVNKAIENNIYTLPVIIFILLPLVMSFVWSYHQKPKYKIILYLSSGSTFAFTSKDKEYIKNVVTALNDARNF